MAKIISNDVEVNLEDGSEIQEACENEFNIPFGCKDGLCGTCIIEIEEGVENLNEKNKIEEDLLPDNDKERLACQCKINKGVVKIRY